MAIAEWEDMAPQVVSMEVEDIAAVMVVTEEVWVVMEALIFDLVQINRFR